MNKRVRNLLSRLLTRTASKTSPLSNLMNLASVGSRTFSQTSSISSNAFDRSKPHVNIGTIGHVGDGKTTLTAAITKILAAKGGTNFLDYDAIDNTPVERARGITISTTHVEYETVKRHYSHTDCPGYVDYIDNMIIGGTQMDGAIVVMTATHGQIFQAKEHLLLAGQVGIQHLVVFINKVDTIDDLKILESFETEMRELLNECGFAGNDVPIVIGSALCALEGRQPEIGEQAIIKLLDAVDENIPIPERELNKPFLMPVENIFSISDEDTVVTGCVERGSLKKGEEVEIVGRNATPLKAIVAGIQMFKKELDSVMAGDNAGVLLRGIRRDQLKRGMVLAKPGTAQAHTKILSSLYILSKDEGGRHSGFSENYKPQMFIRTANVTVVMKFPSEVKDHSMKVMPGDNVEMEFDLIHPTPLEAGQRFNIREACKTVCTGLITRIIA